MIVPKKEKDNEAVAVAEKTEEKVPLVGGHTFTEADMEEHKSAPSPTEGADPGDETAKVAQPEKNVETESEQEDIDAEFLALAEDAGYTADEVERLGREQVEIHIAAQHRREANMRLAQMRNRQPEVKTETKEETIDEGDDLGLTDEDLRPEVAEKLNKHFKTTNKALAELKAENARLKSDAQKRAAAAQEANTNAFVAAAAKLNPSLSPDTAEGLKNLQRLAMYADITNEGRLRSGLEPLKPEAAARQAFAIAFPKLHRERIEKKATTKITKALADSESQIIGKPQKPADEFADMTEKEAAIQRVSKLTGEPFNLADLRERHGGRLE